METVTLSRIDYVRVLYRGPAGTTERWQNVVRDCIPDKYRVTAAEMRKHCKFGTMFDGATKKVVPFFEIWGIAADEFAYDMPIFWKDSITRLDFRSTIPDPPKDPAALTEEFMTVNGNNRRTIAFRVSPPRTKAEGRDAGGKSITIGSHESDRRLAIYKRGKERWALEAQFSRQGVRDVLSTAYAYWAEQAGITWYDALVKVLYQRTADHTLNVTGHTMEEWYGEDWWHNQEGIYNNQENLLELMDMAWDKLDPQSRASFVDGSIKRDGYVHERFSTVGDIAQQADPNREPEPIDDNINPSDDETYTMEDIRDTFDAFDYEEFRPDSSDV